MTDSTIEAPATPRLKQQYKDVIVPELEKEFKYSNPMQVARVQTVVGQHAGDGALLAAILAADDLDQVAALDLGCHVRSPPGRGTRCA